MKNLYRLGLMQLFFASILIAAPAIHATSFIYETAAEIIDFADAIVVGTVLSATPLYDDGTPWTYYEIAIDEVIKGDVESPVLRLRFYGGEMPDGAMVYLAGSPRLSIRETYLLFISEGAVPIVNWTHGIFRFRQRPDTGETVLTWLEGQALFGIVNGDWQGAGVRLPSDHSYLGRIDEAEKMSVDKNLKDAPSADTVLEKIRGFVTQRRGETSFKSGRTIQSVALPAQEHPWATDTRLWLAALCF